MNKLWDILVYGNRNDEGERVLNFCNVNYMKIMNTFSNTGPAINTPGLNNDKQTYDRQTRIDLFLTTNHHRLVVMNTKYKYTAI